MTLTELTFFHLVRVDVFSTGSEIQQEIVQLESIIQPALMPVFIA